ncbi:MAG TPA: c-type cytochrome [Pseudomonadales bacterium]|mgnify:FL=1|nr:c-type cytochrome [Pseudomonadales bacterium]
MIKRIAVVVAACALAGNVLAAGNAEGGKALSVACGACHGADGNSLAPTFPKLAGQHESYLLKQLKDIKSGARSVPTMAGQLDAMSEQDLADIAAYYAAQAATPGVAKEELVELGESVFRAGIREKGVAACAACHSPTGAGNGPARFPALSGQHADYIAAQLRAFRNDERTNDGDTRIMRDVASRLSDKELDAVSSYASGLH